ncbi:MAG: serine/threonine-protein kinase [Acidobacteriota bacterium]
MTERVQELFHEVADLAALERDQYFERNQVDAETRRQVEELVAFDSQESHPLERDIGLAAATALTMFDAGGVRCGAFRLKSVLGRGGMGVVYLAEREDGEVKQLAAVKLLRPGLREKQRGGFLLERQILAELNHPHIARLLDAGHVADGQPYLAMEYVQGLPVDEFTAGMSVREKVSLFLKVCSAVAYLHRNLVVHRDLKPGNILVTAEGEPKLLDFGIARMLDLTQDSTLTETRMLTPGYASPEQLLGERAGTQSDIYSLGAVLHQLLAGIPPRGAGGETPGSISSALRKEPIPRPSLQTPSLKGDLEAILMKAMRPEPQARYGTVEQMADDLQAYLSFLPVQARQGDLLYHAGKFARRYWVPVLAAALAMGGLSIGLFLANRERVIAQRRFEDLRQLSNKLFDIDAQVRHLPGGAKTRQLIVDTSLEYLRRLAGDGQMDPALALDVGTAYMRVGRVQGVPISANLGQADKAEQSLQAADRLIAFVLKEQPGNRVAYLRAAQIAHDRMVLAESRRPDTGAMPLARKSEEWLTRYLASGPVDEAEKQQVVIAGMNIANWYVRKGQTSNGLDLLQRVVAIAKATGQLGQAGAAQIVTARALRAAGDLDGALAVIEEGVRLLDGPEGNSRTPKSIGYGRAVAMKGQILGDDGSISMGRYPEAVKLFELDYNVGIDQSRRDPADAESRFRVSGTGIHLAGALEHLDTARALAVYDAAVQHAREIKENSRARRDEAEALAKSAALLVRLGRLAEAKTRLAAAFALLRELKQFPAGSVAPGSEADAALRALAWYQAKAGTGRRGVDTIEQLNGLVEADKPEPDIRLADAMDLSTLYEQMAVLYRGAGQRADAERITAKRLALWRAWNQKLPGNAFVQRQLASK